MFYGKPLDPGESCSALGARGVQVVVLKRCTVGEQLLVSSRCWRESGCSAHRHGQP